MTEKQKEKEVSEQNNGGTKHDNEKLPLELISPYAIEGLGKVLLMGKKKYGARNWEAGFNYTRVLGAIFRHAFALLRGERIDPESGLFHGFHIMAETMFLCHFFETKTGTDDLPNKEKVNGGPGDLIFIPAGNKDFMDGVKAALGHSYRPGEDG